MSDGGNGHTANYAPQSEIHRLELRADEESQMTKHAFAEVTDREIRLATEVSGLRYELRTLITTVNNLRAQNAAQHDETQRLLRLLLDAHDTKVTP